MIVLSILLSIGFVSAQLPECGKATVGLGIFGGCSIQNYAIVGDQGTCYSASEQNDPDSECAIQWSCNCEAKTMTIQIYNDRINCTSSSLRSATTLGRGDRD
eukprot:379044_1